MASFTDCFSSRWHSLTSISWLHCAIEARRAFVNTAINSFRWHGLKNLWGRDQCFTIIRSCKPNLLIYFSQFERRNLRSCPAHLVHETTRRHHTLNVHWFPAGISRPPIPPSSWSLPKRTSLVSTAIRSYSIPPALSSRWHVQTWSTLIVDCIPGSACNETSGIFRCSLATPSHTPRRTPWCSSFRTPVQRARDTLRQHGAR